MKIGFELNRFVLTFLALTVLACCAKSNPAQSKNSDQENQVVVKSWKGGTGNIREQALYLTLGKDVNEYEFDTFDASRQKLLRIRARRTFHRTPLKGNIPCWGISLHEVTKDANGGNVIGYDLLDPGGPGAGGDYIPREAWASLLCPIEKPKMALDQRLYAVRTERVFRVEGFSFSVQVTDYDYDEGERSLNKLELRVEFKNEK